MSDLISRKAVISLMYELLENSEYDGDKIICTEDSIEKLPTAYDVDKVAEELKKEFKKYYGGNWDKAPYLVKAIEIVKGAVKDE